MASAKKTTGSISISKLYGDNVINSSEISSPFTVLGTASASNSSDTYAVEVVVTNNAGNVVDTLLLTNLTPSKSGSLSWSIADAAEHLADGSYQLTAYLFDTTQSPTISIASSIASSTASLTVDTNAAVSISPVDANWAINAAQSAAAVNVSGTTIGIEAGQKVTVKLLDNVGHTVATVTTQTLANGTWSTSLPQATVSGLAEGSYSITASVSDVAGNTGNFTHSLVIDRTPPTITMASVAGDGVLNFAESQTPLTITGTANGADGQTVTVSLNGQNFTSAPIANGQWSVVIGTSDLAKLGEGSSYQIQANVHDVVVVSTGRRNTLS
jgi:plastocyanin